MRAPADPRSWAASAVLALLACLAAAKPLRADVFTQTDVVGLSPGGNLGKAVSGIGDLDGDLQVEVAAGVPYDDILGQIRGSIRVYSGEALATGPVLAGSSPDEHFGISLAGGDFNGDGRADVAVGARLHDGGATDGGAVLVYLGPDPQAAVPLIFAAEAADDWLGQSVRSAGDVNGDGFEDLIAGAPYNDANATAAGRAYLLLGGDPMDMVPDLILEGASEAHSHFGWSVGGGVDFNGDGYHDVIVGARLSGSGPNRARGRAYVFLGGDLLDPVWDLTFDGESSDDWFGQAVSGAGDVNGDGYGDFVIGAHFSDPSSGSAAGQAYVFFGGASLDSNPDLVLAGPEADAQLGNAVSGAGDLDEDGFDDVLVGAHFADTASGSAAGRAFVLLGAQLPQDLRVRSIEGRAPDAQLGEAVGRSDLGALIGVHLDSSGAWTAGKAILARFLSDRCGDIDGDRDLDVPDAQDLASFLAVGESPSLPAGSDRCSVIAPLRPCDLRDLVVLRRAIAGLAPGVDPVCAAQVNAASVEWFADARAAPVGGLSRAGIPSPEPGSPLPWSLAAVGIVVAAMRVRRTLGLVLVLGGLAAPPASAQDPYKVTTRPDDAPIRIDGILSPSEWSSAVADGAFYETDPSDRAPPPAETRIYFQRDERYLYVGIDASDPAPGGIEASLAARDRIPDTDDRIGVFIDATHDHTSALVFYVNPLGSRADGIWDDVSFSEDLSPDFFHDAAARIHGAGWSAELRIPFSSLRYSVDDRERWRILVWRNYPRQIRRQLHGSPIPRNANCRICHARPLDGLGTLPNQAHLTVAPYLLLGQERDLRRSQDPLSGLESYRSDDDLGVDLKWQPAPHHVFDATVNPDFSLVEADVPQVDDNERFALFFPELRPFFLEGVNLFGTPIPAVHTRTITSPRWGVRATGRVGSTAYSLLSVEDRGGGSVILPGPTGSRLAAQDFRSWVTLGRVRRDFGGSFVGMMLVDREIRSGGHNRLLGPDFHWRIGEEDTLTGQLLLSRSETPERPDLASEWTGDSLSGSALTLNWTHVEPGPEWALEYRDFDQDFRADTGFVPQVGFRDGHGRVAYNFYPRLRSLTRVKPQVSYRYALDRDGDIIGRIASPGIELHGARNSIAQVEVNSAALRIGEELFDRTNVFFLLQIDPGTWIQRLNVNGTFGPEFDFENGRVGDGGRLSLTAVLRPTRHLELELLASREWLDIDEGGLEGRLFTTDIWRAKATYTVNPDLWVRLILQQVETDRDPALYLFPAERRTGGLEGSLVISYRVNWQTSVDLGYEDRRLTTPRDRLAPTGQRLFLKASYAFRQ